MKRKRGSKGGHKKGKKKELAAVNDPISPPSNLHVDEDLGSDDNDDLQMSAKDEAELPSVLNEREILVNPETTKETPKGKSVYGRVKVKLKSSRLSEPSNTKLDAQANEIKKGNVHTASPTPESLVEKKEASNYSDGQSSDMQPTASEKSPRKAGSIKIISSRGLGSSNVLKSEKYVRKAKNSLQMTGPGLSDNEKTAESSISRKVQSPYAESGYNENELNTALGVIKKIMKMDAAEPFNTPVDPIALGIPDYFDVIETPMDFGTIRKNLEHGHKYLNSKYVFKDVQFIWENCYKYNNKGDYILDLMKRVKRNFMKYWVAAGLNCETPGHVESTQTEDAMQSGNQKLYLKIKGKSSKQKRKRHGIDLHKSGCLCAVCVVRRRRREREGTSMANDSQMTPYDDSLSQELRHEKSSPVENVFSEHTSSSLEHSPEDDATGEVELEHDEMFASPGQPEDGGQVEHETCESEELQTLSNNDKPFTHTIEDEAQMSGPPFETQEVIGDTAIPAEDQQENSVNEQDVQTQVEAENEQMELTDTQEHISVYEDPLREENRAILRICHTLFTNDPKSPWRGPHSLNRRPTVSRRSPIQAAMSMFMKW